MGDGNLFEQQAANRRRSAILVGIFLLFFAWIGFGSDLILYLHTSGTAADASPDGEGYRHVFPWIEVNARFGVIDRKG